MSEEKKKYPDATLKITKSKKGVLIIIPDPFSGTSHSYITSVAYLKGLMEGRLKGGLLACSYMDEVPYGQFMSSNDKKIHTIDMGGINPFSASAVKKREESKVKNVDEW